MGIVSQLVLYLNWFVLWEKVSFLALDFLKVKLFVRVKVKQVKIFLEIIPNKLYSGSTFVEDVFSS